MTCTLISEQLDDYLRGDLPGDAELQLDRHLGECADCRRRVDDQRVLQARLSTYGATTIRMPDAGFYDRAIARAAQTGIRRQRNRWMMTGFGGAVAAMFVLWMVSGVFLTTDKIDAPAIPSVTMALEAPQTFNLVFSSATPLTNATMTVALPEGVEIDGFTGQREITWQTSLKEGRNFLPLTLVATSPVGGEILATLRHDGNDKIFRLRVSVNQT